MKAAKISLLSALTLILTFMLAHKPKGDYYKLPKLIKDRYVMVPQAQDKSVGSFYMSKYEVSNLDYREFLYYLKTNGESEKLAVARIDTINWINEFPKGYTKPFAEHYHTHQAYNNYPVVNVSLEAAKLYCSWLTDRLNEYVKDEDYKLNVQIPSRKQWLSAANGGREDAVYSWKGSGLRHRKEGSFLCNFYSLDARNIYYDSSSSSYQLKTDLSYDTGTANNAEITATVNTYWPNEMGIYNLNGNAAEWVREGLACGGSWRSTGYDVRNQSVIKVDHSSCMVGFRPILVFSKK